MTPLSGTQYQLVAADYTATVASVGATLRELTWRGRHLVVPFEADEVRPSFRGALLAPWPNRVVDGKYHSNGIEHELPLTEPARGHALHGLVAWQEFERLAYGPSSVTLAATLQAQSGYPFRLDLVAGFELSESGLTINLFASNTGKSSAPYGTGIHPYLVAGGGGVDNWELELPAKSILSVTPDRLVPQNLVSVSDMGGRFDFRRPRQIGDTAIDHAYTDLALGQDQEFTARLTDIGGTGVALAWGRECPWVQVHTADRPELDVNRIGLALEPMTCPPDAFNSGRDLIILPPGGSNNTWWRIMAL